MAAEYFRNPESFMNVLYLDDDPVLAAQVHCDRHVGKMVLSACQILSNVWHSEVTKAPDASWTNAVTIDWTVEGALCPVPYLELTWLLSRLCGNRIYNPRHDGHPCVQWAALYGGNYEWLYKLACALLDEFTYRFDRIHACTPVVRALELVPPPLLGTVDKYCEGHAVMPSDYVVGDTVASYKNFYIKGKTGAMTYTRRTPPEWLGTVAHYKEIA